MKKTYLTSAITLVLGIICIVAYRVIGVEVAPDGTLVEPFFLIPIGWILIILGIVLCVWSLFRK